MSRSRSQNKTRVKLIAKERLSPIATPARVSIDLTKQIKKLTKPVCVKLIDIATIIDFRKYPNTTKILTESALQRIENIETNILKVSNKKQEQDQDQSLVDIQHYETYKKNLQLVSPIAQVLRYDRANESIANESFFEDDSV